MKRILIVLLILLGAFIGYQSFDKGVALPEYNGSNLKIGIIGDLPKVREAQIEFAKITFETLQETDKINNQFDAVFIMKNNLSEAAKAPYSKLYKQIRIPIYFMEGDKNYLPYINDDIEYEDKRSACAQPVHAVGIWYAPSGLQTWTCGYYNDQKNQRHIQLAYSMVFAHIMETKNNQSTFSAIIDEENQAKRQLLRFSNLEGEAVKALKIERKNITKCQYKLKVETGDVRIKIVDANKKVIVATTWGSESKQEIVKENNVFSNEQIMIIESGGAFSVTSEDSFIVVEGRNQAKGELKIEW